jgi:hypothetical protein
VRPDAIFVAGDFLDRLSALQDPSIVRLAAEEIVSLPATAGRFVALGEEETAVRDALRAAWSVSGLTVGDNDAWTMDTRGGPLDLFIANVRTDAAPWGIGDARGRTALTCRGRHVTSWLHYDGPDAGAWGDVEITLAFRVEESYTFIDLRFGWHGDDSRDGGTGWHLERHAYDRAFRLVPDFPGKHVVSGRTASGYVPEPGIWHRARIRVRDDGAVTRVRARFWAEAGREPDRWLIDAIAPGPDRRREGTVGFAARAGTRAIADLRVTGPDGAALLVEPFDDRARFDAGWRQGSRLVAWARAESKGPRLVLSHHPDVVLDLALIGAPPPALVVAGHTHGGQVAIPGIGPLFTSSRLPRRLARGFGSWRGIPLFVTVGVGTSVLPLRLGVRPEVVVLTLAPAGAGTMRDPGEPR